jgi:amino acid transporter
MGLERLNILFFLINATGMLPYRMILDKKKKRFERFDIGWRHPVTWWFVVVLITQLIYTP